MAIGAGALISAIAYELVPESVLGAAGMGQWRLCIGVALILLILDEVVKFFMRQRRKTQAA